MRARPQSASRDLCRCARASHAPPRSHACVKALLIDESPLFAFVFLRVVVLMYLRSFSPSLLPRVPLRFLRSCSQNSLRAVRHRLLEHAQTTTRIGMLSSAFISARRKAHFREQSSRRRWRRTRRARAPIHGAFEKTHSCPSARQQDGEPRLRSGALSYVGDADAARSRRRDHLSQPSARRVRPCRRSPRSASGDSAPRAASGETAATAP